MDGCGRGAVSFPFDEARETCREGVLELELATSNPELDLGDEACNKPNTGNRGWVAGIVRTVPVEVASSEVERL